MRKIIRKSFNIYRFYFGIVFSINRLPSSRLLIYQNGPNVLSKPTPARPLEGKNQRTRTALGSLKHKQWLVDVTADTSEDHKSLHV